MRRSIVVLLAFGSALFGPIGARADHDPPHDTRPNPNCAYDTKRNADWDGDGEPDHFVAGVSQNTSFPRQIVTHVWKPLTNQDGILFFGTNDGPDNATLYMQGDHRMLGANPAHQPNGEPEQLHNGAIRVHVDYDDVENGRTPRAEAEFGIYEANHLAMTCVATDDDPEAAICPNGTMVYRTDPDEPCPTE